MKEESILEKDCLFSKECDNITSATLFEKYLGRCLGWAQTLLVYVNTSPDTLLNSMHLAAHRSPPQGKGAHHLCDDGFSVGWSSTELWMFEAVEWHAQPNIVIRWEMSKNDHLKHLKFLRNAVLEKEWRIWDMISHITQKLFKAWNQV